MDLIYTNSSRVDQGVLLDYDLDLAFGADENNLECRVQAGSHCCESGSLLYMEGTEYGGIVDSIESDTDKKEVTYTGRTWHGILNSKVLQPDSGEAYLTVSGEANSVIASLLTRMGLEDLFEASSEDSKLTVSGYKMNRYISGYDGIMKMLGTIGGKLKMAFSGGKVVLSAVPRVDYTQDEEFDADQVSFRAKRTYKGVNHLICLGSGQLEERLVVHLYSDTDGKISQTQTQFGIDEICSTYDYSTIETEEELIQEGMGQFESLKASDEINIDFDADSDVYDVGDIIGAVDNVTGIFITTKVAKKIVTIKNGEITISLTPETVRNSSIASGGGSSGGGGGYAVTQYYVTPQMFGAVGDGVADDTDAVQAALDCGGEIYFPAGRYKVTRQLNAIKSCRIRMFKPYPTTYKAEYPLTDADNWMGARIETYATDGIGFLVGDSVQIDGMTLRAKAGFVGTLFKVDTTFGLYNYPALVRISGLKLENDSTDTTPESMFDFVPDGSYNFILEDITIGRMPNHPRCTYGFRADLTNTPRKWCNNVFIRNLCIDMWATIPVYVDGANVCDGWVFDGLVVQTYNFEPGHEHLLVLKNMKYVLFSGSYLWDTTQANIVGAAIYTESVSDLTCVGCSSEFDAVETGLSTKMKRAENLNIANLVMSVSTDADTGANVLVLSDGTRERSVSIPAATVSEEQVGQVIDVWMDENAAPKEVAGRNKLNIYADPIDPLTGTIEGYYYKSNYGGTYIDKSGGMWMTNPFPAVKGDILRVSVNGVIKQPWGLYCLDADMQILDLYNCYAGNSYGIDWRAIEVTVEGTKYVRFSLRDTMVCAYADRAGANICITVNNANVTYEPYETHLEGGLGSFMVLQSPNGAKYTLVVDDDGNLYASPV